MIDAEKPFDKIYVLSQLKKTLNKSDIEDTFVKTIKAMYIKKERKRRKHTYSAEWREFGNISTNFWNHKRVPISTNILPYVSGRFGQRH